MKKAPLKLILLICLGLWIGAIPIVHAQNGLPKSAKKALQRFESDTSSPLHKEPFVVIYRSEKHFLNQDGSATIHVLQLGKVNQKLKEQSIHLWIPFDAQREKVTLRKSSVIKSSGESIDNIAISETFQRYEDLAHFEHLQAQQIQFPSLEVNDLVELQYQKKITKPLLDEFYSHATTNLKERKIYTLDLIYNFPIEQPLLFEVHGALNHNTAPDQSRRGLRSYYQWHWEYSSPDFESLTVSNDSNWSSLTQWFIPLMEIMMNRDSPFLENLLKETIGDKRDRKEIIKLLYRFVADEIETIPLSPFEGSWLTQSPQDIVNSGYTDTMGKAVLLTALLQQANIPAFPTFVPYLQPNGGRDILPTLQMKATLVAIQEGPEWSYLDPSLPYSKTYFLKESLQNQLALILNNIKPIKTRTTTLATDHYNKEYSSNHFAFLPSGDAEQTSEMILHGKSAQASRTTLLPLSSDEQRQLFEKSLDKTTLLKYAVKNLDVPDLPLSFKIKRQVRGLGENKNGIMTITPPALSSKVASDGMLERKDRIWEAFYHFPKGALIFKFPEDALLINPHGSYTRKVESQGKTLKIFSRYVIDEPSVLPDGHREFDSFIQRIAELENQTIEVKIS